MTAETMKPLVVDVVPGPGSMSLIKPIFTALNRRRPVHLRYDRDDLPDGADRQISLTVGLLLQNYPDLHLELVKDGVMLSRKEA